MNDSKWLQSVRHIGLLAHSELRQRRRDPVAFFWMIGFPLVLSLFLSTVASSSDIAPMTLGVTKQAMESDAVLRAQASAAVKILPRESARGKADVQAGRLVAFFDGQSLWVDPSKRIETTMLHAILATEQMAPINVAPIGMSRPSPRALALGGSLLWGLFGCTATFAMSLAEERVRGTYQRLRMTPLARSEIMLGKALAAWFAQMAVLFVLLGIGVLGMCVRPIDPVALAVACVATTACFVGIMMLFSTVGRTPQAVGNTGWSVMLIIAMLGGAMVPFTAMPAWARSLSAMSPAKWAIDALEVGIWRGGGLAALEAPVGILFATGVLTFAIGVWRFNRAHT